MNGNGNTLSLTPEEVRILAEAIIYFLCVCGAFKLIRGAFF